MKTTIGRIVVYKTTKSDRETAKVIGNNVQEELPAIIVSVWNDTLVNLRVLSDGNSLEWKTSIIQGDGEGQWNWPVINK